MDDFDFVSIREKAGVNICNSVGIPATKVLDPVFLLSSDDYLKFVKTSKYTSPYVYIYSLNIKHPNEIMWGDFECYKIRADQLMEKEKYLAAYLPV